MVHVARLLRERAVPEHADPGGRDLRPRAVPRRQAPQVPHDLPHGLRVEAGEPDLELERVGRPGEAGQTEQHADLGLVRALEHGALGCEPRIPTAPASMALTHVTYVNALATP